MESVRKQISYHLRLMAEGDLLTLMDVTGIGDDTRRYIMIRLTWAGCEFASLAKDFAVWVEMKSRLGAIGGSASFAIVLALLRTLVEERLNETQM